MRSPASMRTVDSGIAKASQIALSNSLEGSLRPRSTSDRYPRLTRAESETSRNVRPCEVLAWRNTSPMTSRTNNAIAQLLRPVTSARQQIRSTSKPPLKKGLFAQRRRQCGGSRRVTTNSRAVRAFSPGRAAKFPGGRGHVVDAGDDGEHDRDAHEYRGHHQERAGQRQHEQPDGDRLDHGLE